MNQQNDLVFQIISDSIHSLFASPFFRYLIAFAFSGFVLSTCVRWIKLLVLPSRHEKPWKQAKKEPVCAFRCDCVDCVSYESGKYCPRCDRFEMCAYCSAREHCDL